MNVCLSIVNRYAYTDYKNICDAIVEITQQDWMTVSMVTKGFPMAREIILQQHPHLANQQLEYLDIILARNGGDSIKPLFSIELEAIDKFLDRSPTTPRIV